jgi:hypothetical protein
VHGDEPSETLCQAQGALMLAFSPALSALALSLVLTVSRLITVFPIVTLLIEPPLGVETGLVGSQRSNPLVQPEPV